MKHPLERARQLAAVAPAHADRSEQERRLAAPVVDAFVASGLARLIAPTALGGWAAPPTTLVEVVDTVSAADPSAGWCVGIGLGANFLSGFLPDAGAEELFTELDRPGAGVFAPTGRGTTAPGGFCLSGRWAFASGCQHAAVQASGMFAVDANGDLERDRHGRARPPPRLRVDGRPCRSTRPGTPSACAAPAATTRSMRGPVRAARAHAALHRRRPGADDALFQQPPFAVLGPCLGAVPLGLGRAALDAVEEHIRRPTPRPSPVPSRRSATTSWPSTSSAGPRSGCGRCGRCSSTRSTPPTRRALAGTAPRPSDVALIGLACQEAMAAAVHAVDVAVRISGTSSVRDDSRLDRLQRDVNTMRQHIMFSPAIGAPLGRQLAGIDTVAFPFLVPTRAGAPPRPVSPGRGAGGGRSGWPSPCRPRS